VSLSEVAVPSAPVVRVQESAGLATLVTLKVADYIKTNLKI